MSKYGAISITITYDGVGTSDALHSVGVPVAAVGTWPPPRPPRPPAATTVPRLPSGKTRLIDLAEEPR